MSFGGDLQKFADKTEDKMRRAIRKITIDVFENVVLMSPVDTGRFRGNWQPSIGVMRSGTTEAVDPFGTAAYGRISTVAGGVELGDTIYMVNNLPYAERLEDGHSNQAPGGMVKLTVQRFQPIADQIIAQIGKT